MRQFASPRGAQTPGAAKKASILVALSTDHEQI